MAQHVGVVLPTREALLTGTVDRIAEFALAAEAAGLDSLWAGDSLLARPLLDPFTALATAAAVTTRVTLGTGVLLAPLRPPALTAQAIASLDRLSGGRFVVGVGRGFDLPETRREFAAAGADFDGRMLRTEETLRFWKALWRDGRASLNRSYGFLDDGAILPEVARPGGPPVWLAGFGKSAFDLVGRHADGWLPYPPDSHDYTRGWHAVRAAAQAAGRDPDAIVPAMMITVALGDRRYCDREIDEHAEAFYGFPAELVASVQAYASGPPDEALAKIRTYWEAGARSFVLRLGSLHAVRRQLDLAAEHLLSEIHRW